MRKETSLERRNRYDREVNFVPALREPDPPKPVIIDIDPREIVTLPSAALTQTEIRTSHVDRAKGFQIVSVPLAGAVGAGSLIVGIVGFSVPVFSVAALAWLWGGFLATWLAAWVVHNVVSPDGIALLHTLLGWSYLRREQTERHKRYRRAE